MVERKLTGVVTTVQVDIPFEAFEIFVTHLHEHLAYLDVDMAKADVAISHGVLQAFEQGIQALLSEIDWNDASEYIEIEDTADLLFPEQIKVAQEIEEERSRIAQAAYEEELRLEREENQRLMDEMRARMATVKPIELPKDPSVVTMVVKNKFLRKLVTMFGEKV